jgi:hypothetical protein
MKQNLQNGTSVPEQTMLKMFETDDCEKCRLLLVNPVQFAKHFNREPFSLKHNLSDEQLLNLANITELTRSLQIHPGELYADVNVLRVDQRWNESPRTNVSPANLVEEINKANAWIIIRHAELDPKYRTLLERGMFEIKQANGGYWQQPIRKENAIIFVTSPRRISTYHIDRECNFILQIQGEKWIFVFDQNDREVLPEEELERFWAVDNNAAVYKPQYQDRCQTFHLRPGDGLHVPVNAPHWVQNGNEVSITLSLNFQFSDMERANKYRANYYLRKLGVTPAPPGRYPTRDRLKASVISGATLLRRPLKALIG